MKQLPARGPTRRGRRALLLLCAGLALLPVSAPYAQQPAAGPGVVVWDFDNQTPPGAAAVPPGELNYLQRALAEAVTLALLDIAQLPVVERQRLRDLLAEQKVGASELADTDARLRLGRIVGASRMVFGGFFALGDQVQVNVRVVDSATSRVLFSDEFNAPIDAAMARAEALARRLAHALGGGAALGRGYPAHLWQAYDRALALSDAGEFEQAVAALQRLLAAHNDFTPAERQLVALLDKMRRR
jgi:TolB-like protein